MTCTATAVGNRQTVAAGFISTRGVWTVELPGSVGKFVAMYNVSGTGIVAVVGTVDSAGDTTYGTPVTVNSSLNNPTICAVSATKVVIASRPSAENDMATIVGTISGTSISFGSVQVEDPTYSYSNVIAADPSTGKVLLVYSISGNTRMMAGDVSGTSIVWGSIYTLEATRRREDNALIAIGGNKFLYVDSGAANEGAAFVLSVSGTVVSAGTEHQLYASRAVNCRLAWDPTAQHAMVLYTDIGTKCASQILSVSGTNVTSGSSYAPFSNDVIENSFDVSFNATTEKFTICYSENPGPSDYYLYARVASVAGTAIDWCTATDPIDVEVVLNDCRSPQLSFIEEDGYHIFTYPDLTVNNIYARTLSDDASPVVFGCNIKPKQTVVVTEGTPGVPGYPGQAHVPGYCVPGYCSTVTYQTVVTPDGTYEYRCVTGPSEESLILGFPEQETFCSMTPVVAQQSTDPYAPNYDPNYDPSGAPSSDLPGLGVRTVQYCTSQKCYSAIPYIPPSPPTPPSQTQYSINYNLGWNHDVLIATGSNLTIDVGIENVRNDTSGIAVGFSNLSSWGLAGVGKFPIFVLFEANRVRVVKQGSTVWGQAIRALADVFSLRQFGTQVAIYRNDIQIYKSDVLSGGRVAAGAIIYKGGESFCLPLPGDGTIVSETVGLSGSGGGDITLSAIEVIGYEGSYGIGDTTIPALVVEGTTGAHGGADVGLPPLAVISADRAVGWAFTELPSLEATGYAADALNGYATISLPGVSAVGADSGGYAFGAASLPAMTVDASGGFVIPTAQGADVSIPHLMFGATGLTGGVGGANVSIPPLDAVGADREIYGELDKSLPAIAVFGGEYPKYDGVLDGFFRGLEMQDGYGTLHAPNTLDGFLSELSGDLEGGAYLDQSFAALSGELTGNIEVVGRLDGTFLPMEMNSTGLTGMYGEIAGTLGAPLEGALWAGASLDKSFGGLEGNLSATLGATGSLDGAFAAMTGLLSASIGNIGRLDGTFPELESLWGVLDGAFAGLTGAITEALVSVDDYTAWVLNRKTGAISRYPAYTFDFICRLRNSNYVVSNGGIYRIGGEYDIDQPIDAGFSLPSTDLGVSSQKISPRLYLQGELDGQFAVTTMADNLDPVRSVSIIRPGIGYHRCKLPRGIRGTHLEFDVDNVSGADFEIEQVDVLVADTGRKI